MYPPCTSLWRIRWFCRLSRLLKSISCALSIRLRIPTPPASTNCTRAKGVAARTRGQVRQIQSPNLAAPRAFAFSTSSSRFFGGAFVSSECKKRLETAAISSIAARNAASFAFDGLLKPLIFLTNWSDEARISSDVTGGSKLKSVLIFLHIPVTSTRQPCVV